MLTRTRSPKSMTESRRQREVHVRYGAVFRDIPRLDHVLSSSGGHLHDAVPSNHVPQPSSDTALTSFAQSACMRVGASRGMVSLIDGQRQYILAEATPDLFLRSNRSHDARKELWLGAVSLPRTWGAYDSILNDQDEAAEFASGHVSIVVVNDLTKDEKYANRPYVTGAPHIRFYAGVPLVSTKGAIVGTLSVLDDKPRDGLPEKDVLHLKDLADTIVEYLDLCMVKEQYQRGEKLTRALMSFTDGGSVTRPFENESKRQLSATGAELPEMNTEQKAPALAKPQKLALHMGEAAPSDYTRQNSVKSLQESILPPDSRSMFARAASVVQSSSDLDGVLIFDASVAGVGNEHRGKATSMSNSEEHSDVSSGFKSSSNEDDDESNASPLQRDLRTASRKHCQVLGFAVPGRSAFEGDSPAHEHQLFSEKDLARMFHAYPSGKVIDISLEGDVITTTDESDSSQAGAKILIEASTEQTPRPKKDPGGKIRTAKALRAMLPEARSVAFVPLWDYERSRWFAGCLCWSNRLDRKLSHKVDLAYFRVFGHSIMTDLSRLDAIASDQAKTSFVASISHELRSPLHGILGTLEFLKDTALDSFQVSMINSLGSCGQTLLDTINHVLDYAKISTGPNKKRSSKRLKGSSGIHMTSRMTKRRRRDTHLSQHPAVDLERVTEETVEAVCSGQSYTMVQAVDWDAGSDSGGSNSDTNTHDQASNRSNRYIILDIASEVDWNYHLPPGSWRRVVMNLLGNALKYTESGYIHISLRSASSADNVDERIIYLSIKDSGRGMSQKFLANRAFQPFQQENSHFSGTGLGLSIVRQIIDSSGGMISVDSEEGQGTEMRVKFALLKPDGPVTAQPQRTQHLSIIQQLKGRRICILHRQQTSEPEAVGTVTPCNREALSRFTAALAYTLSEHLKMQVVQTEDWEGHNADIVICPEPSFEYLASIRHRRTIDQRAPVTVFVGMDALEAATLRTDVRVKSRESVVEILTQPCGPYKLAHTLEQCLNRFASPEENIWYPASAQQSPLPSIARPTPKRVGTGSYFGSTVDTAVPIFPSWNSTGTASFLRGRSSSTSRTQSREPRTTSTSMSPPKIGKSRPSSGSCHGTISSLDTARLSSTATGVSETTPGVNESTSPMTEVSSSGLSASSLPNRSRIYPSRVLITDDNPINRKLLSAFLKKNKMLYREVGNGAEAVEAYQNASPVRFDVILMDVSMPIMDGMSATRAIREYEQKNDLPRCYIVALTGLASASARLEAWSSGVDHYMTKPVNFKKLEVVLKEEVTKKGKDSKSAREKSEF